MRYEFFDPTHLKHKKIKVALDWYLRYCIRKIIFYSHIKKFEYFINTYPFFTDFFEQYPLATYIVIKSFCNKKFDSKRRIEHKICRESYREAIKISNHWYYYLAHKQESLEEISSNKRSIV